MEINKNTNGWAAFANQRKHIAELEIENQKLRSFIEQKYGKRCVIVVSKDTDDVIVFSKKEHELLIKHHTKNEQSLEIPNGVNNTFITEDKIILQTETSYSSPISNNNTKTTLSATITPDNTKTTLSATITPDNKRTRDMTTNPRLNYRDWSKQWNKNTRIRYVVSNNPISYYKWVNKQYDKSKLFIENSWDSYSSWIVATSCSIKMGSSLKSAYVVCEYYNEATSTWINMNDVAIYGNKLN